MYMTLNSKKQKQRCLHIIGTVMDGATMKLMKTNTNEMPMTQSITM